MLEHIISSLLNSKHFLCLDIPYTYSPVDGHLNGFPVLESVSNIAVNIKICLCKDVF